MSFTASIEQIVARNEGGLLGAAPHWRRMRLADLADIKNGEPLPSQGFNQVDGPPVVRIRNILDGATDTRFRGHVEESWFVETGDLLIGMDGDFNARRWSGPKALLNQRVCRVKPKHGSPVSVEYLAQLLPGYLSAINRNTPSITVKHLSSRTLADLPIPVPPPQELRSLVAAVDGNLTRIDTAEASLRRAKANVKRARAAVLKAAVDGRLVPTEAELARAEGRDFEPATALLKRILAERKAAWAKTGRGKYQEPVAPDTVGLPELPEGWCWATVDQLGEVVTGRTPADRSTLKSADRLPFMKPTDLDAGENVRSAREFLGREGTAQARVVPSGSVLVTCIGATIGKTGFARVPCATNQQINAVVLPPPVVGEFVFRVVTSPAFQAGILASASATTLPILNKSKFERLSVPLPPVPEQERLVTEIARRLSQIDSVETALDANLARCAKARQSVLKMAFEGRLVPQAQTTTTTARYLAASLA